VGLLTTKERTKKKYFQAKSIQKRRSKGRKSIRSKSHVKKGRKEREEERRSITCYVFVFAEEETEIDPKKPEKKRIRIEIESRNFPGTEGRHIF